MKSSDFASLTKILTSKNPKTQMLGLLAAGLFFAPTVFQVMGDDGLNVWRKLERLSVAAAQAVGAVILALPDYKSDEESIDIAVASNDSEPAG